MSERPPRLGAAHALFVDFDGTLVEIVDHPDAVQLPADLVGVLESVQEKLGGALAVVSGRGMDDVGERLAPLRVSLAGSHGMERRGAGGHEERPGQEIVLVAQQLAEALAARCGHLPGILIERKSFSVAVHYRGAPQREDECLGAITEAVAGLDGWEVVRGKMVAEARLAGVSKASAVRAFMHEPPFAGRMPVFIGDDVTDEDGMGAAQELGGFGIKVGQGDTIARYRLENPRAVLEYLRSLLD